MVGGKNNTRNMHEVPKKMMDVSVKKNKDRESTLGLTEKIVKETGVEQKSVLSHTSTPNIVSPGSYHFLPEVYPWLNNLIVLNLFRILFNFLFYPILK